MRMQKSKNLLLVLGSEKVTTSNYTMLGSASKLKPLVSIRYLYILQRYANNFYQATNTTAPYLLLRCWAYFIVKIWFKNANLSSTNKRWAS